MQTSQAHINQEVAVALERLNGLMESTLDRVKRLEDERDREDQRRDARSDDRIGIDRPTLAILIAAISPVLYPIILFVAAHWH